MKPTVQEKPMPIHTLLAITGLSPQVVTETLYGIHKQGLPWPDELIILTTQKGAEKANLGLRKQRANLKKSMLDQCCCDLGQPLYDENNVKIQVVPGHDGNPVDDAITKEDQEALADFIVKQVAQLCEDPQRTLHASLAGGRKTMTFFLGYAMSLFARPEDRLSHVLLNPADYEGLRDFYYPTPYTNLIDGRDAIQQLDTSEENVQVMLVDIPFIRQRQNINKDVLARFCRKDDSMTFRQLIQWQQLACCMLPYDEISLDFNLAAGKVMLFYRDEKVLTLEMKEKPLVLAYYAMIARHNRVTSEKRYHTEKAERLESWMIYRSAYLQELWTVINNGQHLDLEAGEDIYEHLVNYSDNVVGVNYAVMNCLPGLKIPTPTFFHDRKGELRDYLKKILPKELVTLIEPDYKIFYNIKSDDDELVERRYLTPKPANKKVKKSRSEALKFFGLWVSSNLCPKD